ncbi:MAG: fumarylacetoacetate hydrolase family protein [Flavobacteriales bacterium]|nr:fumarylacetoacetate hydrolase family protein [Flavobacteriales bacterium]
MKIFCIGRNYADHAHELGNIVPEEPVLFLKPFTAVALTDKPLHLPEHLGPIHHELELVVSFDTYAKDIPEAMAPGMIASITLGLDLTARAVQEELKRKGLPWEKAKAFDGSAVIGDVHLPMTSATDLQAFRLRLLRNGDPVQEGRTADMIHPVTKLVHHVSRYITIEPGDLLFTGTPAGVGPIERGDVLEGFLDDKRLLHARFA